MSPFPFVPVFGCNGSQRGKAGSYGLFDWHSDGKQLPRRATYGQRPKRQVQTRYGIGSHSAFRFSTGVPLGISHPALTMNGLPAC